jgi:hypothetical protein
MAKEILFTEFGFFDDVFHLDQINWPKVFHPYMPDGIVPGIGNEMTVFANASGMNVFVRDGECRVRSHRGALAQGIELEIEPADSSFKRIDLVVARVKYENAPNSTMKVAVITGQPAASPITPAVTQIKGDIWELALAEVHVDAGVTNIAADKVIEFKTFSQVGAGADPMEIFYYGGF